MHVAMDAGSLLWADFVILSACSERFPETRLLHFKRMAIIPAALPLSSCWPAALLRLLLAFGLCAPLGSLRAAQDDALRPVAKTDVLAERLHAVGQVIAGRGNSLSMGTGFLVSACHVLTAGHVLARVGAAVEVGGSVRFFMPLVASQGMLDGRIVAASPDFVMQAAPKGFERQRIANDWALIELERPVDQVPPIRLLHPEAPLHSPSSFTIAGYPLAERKQGLHAHAHCRQWTDLPMPDILLADCAIQSGMSGGPMLLDGLPQPVAAGILVERFTIGQKVMAIAVPLAAFARQIEPIMRDSEVCAVGAPFVLPAQTALCSPATDCLKVDR